VAITVSPKFVDLMSNLYIKTPLLESFSVGQELDGRVWLKMESSQPSGSFKARGIGHACQHYVAHGAKQLISSSGGNAGLAVAYAGRQLGVPVTVVVPETTKQKALDLIAEQGAEVIVKAQAWHEAHVFALSLLNEQTAYLHPFDDPLLWEGHATLIDEVAESGVRPDVVVLSVGGGGLLCGVVAGLRRNGWQSVPVLAVETKGTASLATAVKANQLVGLDKISGIATSLGATQVAEAAFAAWHSHLVVSHVVSDREALAGCQNFVDEHRTLVEPACGASLAAVYGAHPFLHDKQNILVVVCGGVGVTLKELNGWKYMV